MCQFLSWIAAGWWTEDHAAWTEAIALILIFGLELWLAFGEIRERREARHERRLAAIDRQRAELTCFGTVEVLRAMGEEEMCRTLFAHTFRHAGFAFDTALYQQLPEYMRRKCEPFLENMQRPMYPDHHKTARFMFAFRFPYPNYEAILEDVDHLHFGGVHVVWDDNGKPIKVRRD
jgi:hypothetical protein